MDAQGRDGFPEIRTAWPWGPALVRDYISGTPAAVAFYGRHFANPRAYETVAAHIQTRMDREGRERAARALAVQGDAAQARLARFIAEGGYAVTTGQQPGLLTGPLYSIYKAWTAVHLAARLESMLGVPVLPIFWVASEDHDWEEAGHAHVWDVLGGVQRLDAEPLESPGDRPLHRVRLTALESARPDLERLLPESRASRVELAAVRAAYPEGGTLGDGMAALLLEWLGPAGLCVCQAHDPAIKRASVTVLETGLRDSDVHETLLAERAAELERTGYGVQVPILEGRTNVFWEGASGARERLYRAGKELRLHGSGVAVSPEEMNDALRDGARRLSPNVLLRPVVESVTFPTLAYVGGPGEMAYFAQIHPLFEAMGLEMPVVHPRVSATLIPARVRRILEDQSLAPEDLDGPVHAVESRWARTTLPDPVHEALSALERALTEGADRLLTAAEPIDATLRGPIRRVDNVGRAAVDHARRKILTALKRRDVRALEQVRVAHRALFPDGIPQERVLTLLPFLARHGRGLLEELGSAVGRHVDRIHGSVAVP